MRAFFQVPHRTDQPAPGSVERQGAVSLLRRRRRHDLRRLEARPVRGGDLSRQRELFRQDPLVDVVKPTVGKTGTIEKIRAVEMAHRPGDMLDLTVTGSAFLPNVVTALSAEVNEFAMGPSTFTFISAGKLDVTLRIPPNTPVGIYGVSILYRGKVLEKQPSVFAVVPPNWLASVTLATPLRRGKTDRCFLPGAISHQTSPKRSPLRPMQKGLKCPTCAGGTRRPSSRTSRSPRPWSREITSSTCRPEANPSNSPAATSSRLDRNGRATAGRPYNGLEKKLSSWVL